MLGNLLEFLSYRAHSPSGRLVDEVLARQNLSDQCAGRYASCKQSAVAKCDLGPRWRPDVLVRSPTYPEVPRAGDGDRVGTLDEENQMRVGGYLKTNHWRRYQARVGERQLSVREWRYRR